MAALDGLLKDKYVVPQCDCWSLVDYYRINFQDGSKYKAIELPNYGVLFEWSWERERKDA